MMGISKYLKTVGAISSALLAGPIWSHLSKSDVTLVNPPVGSLSDYWLIPALLVGIAITTFIPPLVIKKISKTPVFIALGLAFASVCLYGWSLLHYGRSIVIPRRNVHDFVIVGTVRSEFALQYFEYVGDVDMMEKRGWSDQDLELYWTKWSLEKARIIVLSGYLLTIIFINLSVCTIAAQPSTD